MSEKLFSFRLVLKKRRPSTNLEVAAAAGHVSRIMVSREDLKFPRTVKRVRPKIMVEVLQTRILQFRRDDLA
jgi:hypothetical protein